MPHQQAGHMTAPDQCCINVKSSCQSGAVDRNPAVQRPLAVSYAIVLGGSKRKLDRKSLRRGVIAGLGSPGF